MSLTTTILQQLNIKHTNAFVRELELDNLQNGNLLGLLRMLSIFGVSSHAGRLDIAEEFLTVEVPFVAQIDGDTFVLVTALGTSVTYSDGTQKKTEPLEDFAKHASLIVAEVKAKDEAIEPDYSLHRQQELWRDLLLLSPLPLLGTLLWRAVQANVSLILVLLCIMGLSLSVMLHRQWLGQSNIVTRACDKLHHGTKKVRLLSRLLHTSQCSAAHDTFFFNRWFDLSEVGVAFFGAVLLSLLLFPSHTVSVSWLAFCSIPFTLWSLGYQFFRQKTWCPFCVAVQLLMWLMAGVCYAQDLYLIDMQHLPLLHMTFLVSLVATLLAVYVLLVTPGVSRQQHEEAARLTLAQIKGNAKVAEQLWGIPFGRGKHHITLVMSPTCPFCEEALLDINQKVVVTGRYELERIYYDIHTGDKERIAQLIGEEERLRHLTWCKEHDIHATPTIFVDGILMPKEYQAKDLAYL